MSAYKIRDGRSGLSAVNVNVRIDTEGNTKWMILTISAIAPLPICLQKSLWFVNTDNSLATIEPLLISEPSTGFPEALTQEHPQASLKISFESIVDQIDKAVVGSVPDPIVLAIKSANGTEYRSNAISLTTGMCVSGDNMSKTTETMEFADYSELKKLIAKKCQRNIRTFGDLTRHRNYKFFDSFGCDPYPKPSAFGLSGFGRLHSRAGHVR